MFDVGGERYTCERTSGKNRWHGRVVHFESYECPEFLWTHTRVRFSDESTGEEILRADVADVGHGP